MYDSNKPRVSVLTVSAVFMLLCGLYNSIFNILRRASHFFETARTAAELNTDYTEIEPWTDIAVSVYDLIVIFNLSAGILALLQLISGGMGILYALYGAFGKNPPKGAAIVTVFGVICLLLGVCSFFSLLMSRDASAFMMLALFITQIISPIFFTVAAARFKRDIVRGSVLEMGECA